MTDRVPNWPQPEDRDGHPAGEPPSGEPPADEPTVVSATTRAGTDPAPAWPAATAAARDTSSYRRPRPDDTQRIAIAQPGRQTGGAISWRGVLGIGIVLFLATTIALFVTGNPNLYPTVTLIGSFLVPATFVAFLYQHQHISSLAFEAIARAFVAGGLLGILAASIVEPILLPHFINQATVQSNGGLTFTAGIVVGLIEETSKLLAIVWVARHLRHVGALDGLLIGAAVGMGFAAFESSGYAFTTLLASQGDVFASLVETVTRGILSPFGHGVWTAIVGAVLFHESDRLRFRYTLPVYAALLFVAVLHGAWDGLQTAPAVILPFEVGISWTMIVVGAIGLIALAIEFRIATRQQADVERAGALPTFD